MVKRRSVEKSVPVSINLPEPVYAFLEWAAHQQGRTVSEHIREWILGSLEPWEGPPLPLDAHSEAMVEMPDELAPDVPTFIVYTQSGPRREDYADVEADVHLPIYDTNACIFERYRLTLMQVCSH